MKIWKAECLDGERKGVPGEICGVSDEGNRYSLRRGYFAGGGNTAAREKKNRGKGLLRAISLKKAEY